MEIADGDLQQSGMCQLSPIHKNSRPYISTAPAIAAGLAMAQIIGTIQVGWSNRLLHCRMAAVTKAGFIPVPGDTIIPALQSFRAAWGGGLFFTFTIGAFLSLSAVGWLRLWEYGFQRYKTGAGILVGICLAVMTVIYASGVDPFAGAYIFLVPASVCLVYPWYGRETDRPHLVSDGGMEAAGREPGARCEVQRTFFIRMLWFLLPLAILAGTGRPFFSPRIFFDVRDRLLLSHPAGRLVNDFYYRYTLFPAESFKSLAQKQIRTFYWKGTGKGPHKKEILNTLVSHDYLPIPSDDYPDVVIHFLDPRTLLFVDGTKFAQIPVSDLLQRPGKIFRQVSETLARHRLLRRLTYVSLVAGFPLLVYLMAHGGVRWIAGWLFSAQLRRVITSIACLLMGITLLWCLTCGRPENLSEETLPQLVRAADGRHRVEALRWMEKRWIDPSQFEGYTSFLDSPRIVERYWVARALGHGGGEKNELDLIRLLKDPSPNVVCMALRSLGERGDTQVIPRLLRLMKETRHWYVQMHAYNALKRLGWRQPVSS
ncbi:MAG: hypothetical protein DSY90_04530 [Deltaproteobacteria bacterium]|nr:MAG: hypothetical protein DSY90_04530 [Deltaproteobacteria bacterium]